MRCLLGMAELNFPINQRMASQPTAISELSVTSGHTPQHEGQFQQLHLAPIESACNLLFCFIFATSTISIARSDIAHEWMKADNGTAFHGLFNLIYRVNFSSSGILGLRSAPLTCISTATPSPTDVYFNFTTTPKLPPSTAQQANTFTHGEYHFIPPNISHRLTTTNAISNFFFPSHQSAPGFDWVGAYKDRLNERQW